MKYNKTTIFAIIFTLSILSACGGGGGGNGGGGNGNGGGGNGAGTGAIQGIVKDANGSPIYPATVSVVGGDSTLTNIAGLFELTSVSTSDRVVVNVTATGYAWNSKIVNLGSDQSVYLQITLGEVTSDTIDATAGGSVSDPATGAELNITGGTLAMVSEVPDGNGNLVRVKSEVTGDVDVGITPIDTSTEAGREQAPGDWRAQTDAGETMLETFGVLTCSATQGGSSLEFEGIAKIPIPSSQADSAPETMDLWYYNEQTGLWEETGTLAKVDCGTGGKCYEGSVNRCSSWNADREFDVTYLKGQVTKSDGTPVSGIEVSGVGVDYNGTSYAYTNDNGYFCLGVRISSQVRVYARGADGNSNLYGPFETSSEATGTIDPDNCCSNPVNIDDPIIYDGTPYITDFTDIEDLLFIELIWDAEEINLDLHLIYDSTGGTDAHIYFGNTGALSQSPFIRLMENAGCTNPTAEETAEGCMPGVTEEIRGYQLSPGTYKVVVHRRDGQSLEFSELEGAFVSLWAISNLLSLTEENLLSLFKYGSYELGETEENAWRVFELVVNADGSLSDPTELNEYIDISDPTDVTQF